MQSFIGLISYFKKSIKGCLVQAKLLYVLLLKDVYFKVDKRKSEVVNLLKKKLIEASILLTCGPKDETELHRDASFLGFGATLM